MNIDTVIIGGLVTWRISNILVKQKGPQDVFIRFRAYLAKRQKRSGGLFDMISCVTCTSMYIGLLASLAVSDGFLEWLAYGLSFSAISSIIEAHKSPK